MRERRPQPPEVIHGLARIEGHVRAIRKMADDGEPPADILLQVSAARSALKKVAQTIVLGHLESDLATVADEDTKAMLAEIRDVLTNYMRRGN